MSSVLQYLLDSWLFALSVEKNLRVVDQDLLLLFILMSNHSWNHSSSTSHRETTPTRELIKLHEIGTMATIQVKNTVTR